jgi:hypothetical protein
MLVLIHSAAFGGLNESKKISSSNIKCADTLVTMEVWTSSDLESLDSRKIILTTTDRAGDKAVLTFVTGSFGAECRSNSLNWSGYLIFQTACPAKPAPTESADRCDFSNNYGIINGSEVLLVPNKTNGKLASEIFESPAKKKPKMKSVKTQFNVYKGK